MAFRVDSSRFIFAILYPLSSIAHPVTFPPLIDRLQTAPLYDHPP